MTDDPRHALSIVCTPSGRNGTVTLTVSLAGQTIAVEKVDLAQSDRRAAFAESLHNKCPAIDRCDLETRLLDLAAERVASKNEIKETPEPTPATAAELLAAMPEATRREARQMLDSPDLMQRVLDDIGRIGLAGERVLAGTIHLVGVSRLLKRPLAAIVQGPSSTGKSYSVEKVAGLFPPESVILATQMTPQALFYMRPGSLSHKFVVAGERSRVNDDESAEATRALREMLSAGKLSKLMPVKNAEGRFVSELVEQEGPIAYIESTTLNKIIDEDANRCLLLNTDERPEQTRRIVMRAAREASNGAFPNVQAVIERHHALQRMLEPKEIIIPYAERLGLLFRCERPEARRAFGQLLGLIMASAVLHQRQRRIDLDGKVIAAVEDYQVARHLANRPLGQSLGQRLPDPVRRFFERLRSWVHHGNMLTTTEAIRQESGQSSERSVRGWLNVLVGHGFVEIVEPGKGSAATKYRLTDKEPDDATCTFTLPSVEDVVS